MLNSNSVSKIEPRTFSRLNKLHILVLSENYISVLDQTTFNGLSSLLVLSLKNNRISNILHGSFSELSSLNVPSLYNNSLSKFDPGAFRGLTSLQMLALHQNQLNTLGSNVFSDLARPLKLSMSSPTHSDNTFHCDVRLCWLKMEERAGTIAWFFHANAVYKPGCADGSDWDSFSCDTTSKINVYLFIYFIVILHSTGASAKCYISTRRVR